MKTVANLMEFDYNICIRKLISQTHNNMNTIIKTAKATGTKDLLIGMPYQRAKQIKDLKRFMSVSDRRYKIIDVCHEPEKINSKIEDAQGEDFIRYDGDSHLITIAPTGSGKNRSVIMPVLLSYEGPAIVLDIKGENYAVTANYRRSIGHKVIALDPFHVVTSKSDRFNPFDILKMKDVDVDTEAMFLAELFARDNKFSKDPFWDNSAIGLIAGLISYLATAVKDDEMNLTKMRSILMAQDSVYELAVVLDTKKEKISEMAFEEIAAYLQMPEQNTRPSVLATVNSYLKPFGAMGVKDALSSSSFQLDEIIEGKPLTIYIIIPPDKLESYGGLIRLWIGTLLKVITMRRRIPELRTLFILDECAQLGYFPFLNTAITLLRAFGLQTWSFWQDLNQLFSNYDKQSRTIINNCGVLQTFGINNADAARQLSEYLNVSIEDVLNLKKDEQLILLNGSKLLRAGRMDYLNDPFFEGKFTSNPYFKL
ncbi:MAG: type IV secretory system conjugative DNA transfer family protein [Bacteroidia bacterium]